MMRPKIRIEKIRQMKGTTRVTMLTAYDYPMAQLVDAAGIDIILVGDSLGNVVLGFDNTLRVTMDMMIHHCAAVSRGVSNALVVGDMPFMSYKISPEQALENAARMIREGGVEAVKIEGGKEMAPVVERLVEAGIAVMGHVGLTPQSVHLLSGFKVQGKDHHKVKQMVESAQALEGAGIFSLVVEAVPEEVGKTITENVSIPTLGIGAGKYCDGQVLVLNDMLGLTPGKMPKFVKQYAVLHEKISEAVSAYIRDVRENEFPDKDHTYFVK